MTVMTVHTSITDDCSDYTGLKEHHPALWSITNYCVDCGGCAGQ